MTIPIPVPTSTRPARLRMRSKEPRPNRFDASTNPQPGAPPQLRSEWSSRAAQNHCLHRINTEKEEADMRRVGTLVFAVAFCFGSQAAIAQSDLINGQVTKVDQSAGKITIKHGPAKKLGMENGMTMVYKAQDASMLKAVKAGNKIKFAAEQV